MTGSSSRAIDHTIVGVSGFSSEVGKTTLMCDLLRAFPGWEAIKVTRGHYRSCGKDPHSCCVSHLLGDHPVIRSGREQTYAEGKDTGRYWDAGAGNVHWVIVTDNQVEEGIKDALNRVEAAGVFIEGNSFLDYVAVNYAVMVARADGGKVKTSARRALSHASAVYLFDKEGPEVAKDKFEGWRESPFYKELIRDLPVYTGKDFLKIVEDVRDRSRVWV